MLTIAKLFGKSPFEHLQNHMHKVTNCMKQLEELFAHIQTQDFEEIEKQIPIISNLEHEADLCKNDIRNHLPKSIFLPIDRSQFLEILSLQDKLADKAEEIGNLFLYQPVKTSPVDIFPYFSELTKKNLDAFWQVRSIIQEMNQLLESSFGGAEAEKVKEMIDLTSYIEYESDCIKRKSLQIFFEKAEKLPYPSFYLWLQIIEEVGAISHISEKLATRIRLILES